MYKNTTIYIIDQQLFDKKKTIDYYSMNHLPNQEGDQFKVPLIGDANVGKTSIVSRMTTEKFTGNTTPTVGVSTALVTVNNVKLSIWDTAGQEKFRSLVPLYTRHSSLLILVFDMNNENSFPGIEVWYNKVRVEMGVKCPIFLCGNKIDLEEMAMRESISEWAKSHDCELFFTSAQTGEGIGQLFEAVAQKVSAQTQKSQFGPSPNLSVANSKSGCC